MLAEKRKLRFRPGPGELSGSAADLGVLVPLVAALVLVNGLEASSILLSAGLLVVFAGLFFRIPFPVQPLKALTAVAVAGRLQPGVIYAAGLEIGLFLLLLSWSKFAERLARIFEKPIVRSLQFGVGLLLLRASADLLTRPPAVFHPVPPEGWLLLLGGASLAIVALAAHFRQYAALSIGLVTAVGAGAAAGPGFPAISFQLPDLGLPSGPDFYAAFFLLVIPQIPLTFGNAVVAVTDLAYEYFGSTARRVTASRVCLSAGFGNVISALAGGMPMCHGAGGLTAHYRLGARNASMNLMLGGTLMAGGLFFAPHVVSLLGHLPVWVLAALLSYAGLRHALLAFDLRGMSLALAVLAGSVGAFWGNLALTSAIALTVHHGFRYLGTAQAAPKN